MTHDATELHERMLRQQLDVLRSEYERQAKPIIDALVRFQAARLKPNIVVSAEMMDMLTREGRIAPAAES